jgi:hypothetical protein
MVLDANGTLGIGTTTLTGFSLVVGKNITGSVAGFGIASNGTIQSDVLTGRYFYSLASTQATTFTAQIFHYQAAQGTFGAGSTVSTQVGFNVTSNLIGATNNYGFYGDIPAGTNRWNFYANGTANNYMAGSLGIGTTSLTGYALAVGKNITGAASSSAIYQNGTVQSDVTTSAYGIRNQLNTAAAAFTLGGYFHYAAQQITIGSTSAITSQYGFLADSSMTGATNNYGFFGNIPSGTNRWNLYMAGTAANFLSGVLNIGTTTLSGYKLDVNGTARFAGNSVFFQNTAGAAGTGYAMEFATNSLIPRVDFVVNGAYVGQFSALGTDMRFVNTTTGNLLFITSANQERARITSGGSFGIGTGSSINASAKVQVDSTTQGFLPPRMTAAQRAAIASPATGLIVYQTDGTEGVYVYSGGTWKSLTMV